MYRLASVLLVTLGLVLFGFAARQTAGFVLEMRSADDLQDRQIADLEQQLRDLRASLETKKPPAVEEDDAIRGIPVGTSPVMGPADALVTMVAFLDYQCPFCKRANDTMSRLLAENSDLRIVIKHQPLPFHKDAQAAAAAVECAHRQGAFRQAHDALYAAGYNELPPALARLDSKLDVNREAFQKCRESTAVNALINEEIALANRVGARGTPTFFINGKKLVGAQPFERFQEAIDSARREARASGIPAARYYVDGVLAKATVR